MSQLQHDESHEDGEKLTIRLPHEIKKKIRQLAEIDRRSINNEIVIILEKYIKENATPIRP